MSADECRRLDSSAAYHLDSQAGAPPDAFSAMGQNWGFPTYDWERMAQDHYAWWRERHCEDGRIFHRLPHRPYPRLLPHLGDSRQAVHGLLGHFNPALPYPAELRQIGFDVEPGGRRRLPLDDATLGELFGDRASEVRGAV